MIDELRQIATEQEAFDRKHGYDGPRAMLVRSDAILALCDEVERLRAVRDAAQAVVAFYFPSNQQSLAMRTLPYALAAALADDGSAG